MTKDELLALARERYNIDDGDPGAKALLDAAVATVDELARIEGDLADAPLTVKSERGNIRANPLLDQALRHRAALARLVGQLFGPDDSPTTRKARHAANTRWASTRR